MASCRSTTTRARSPGRRPAQARLYRSDRVASRHVNASKVKQVRDFGKVRPLLALTRPSHLCRRIQTSRTKYTHLTDQDTTGGGWGTAARPNAPGCGPGTIGTTDTGVLEIAAARICAKTARTRTITTRLLQLAYRGTAPYRRLGGGAGAGTSAIRRRLVMGWAQAGRGSVWRRGDRGHGSWGGASSKDDGGYSRDRRSGDEYRAGWSGRDRDDPYGGRDHHSSGRRDEDERRGERYRGEDERDRRSATGIGAGMTTTDDDKHRDRAGPRQAGW